MNKSVKDLWVNALLSGQYVQGFGSLRRGDAYCPIGVLCDVFSKKFPSAEWTTLKGADTFLILKHGEQLPVEIEEWSGISKDQRDCLTVLNDDLKISFSHIAYIIDMMM